MNPLGGFGRDISEIAALLIGVSVIGLLVTNSQGAGNVINAVSTGFGGVLRIATFQNNFGAPLASLGGMG
jgi:hypothetical protein